MRVVSSLRAYLQPAIDFGYRHPKIMPYLLISVFAFLFHGMHLLNDGIYIDDWVWLDYRNDTMYWSRLFESGKEMGSFFYEPYLSRIYTIFPSVIWGAKVVGFASTLISAVLVFVIAERVKLLGTPSSLAIALIFLTYPAFSTQVFVSTTFYLVYLTVFLLAVLLLFISLDLDRTRKIILQIISGFLFFFSFSLNSLLVYYYGFLLLICIFYLFIFNKEKRSLNWFTGLNFAALSALPVIYWFLKRSVNTRSGFYAEYNELQLSPYNLIAAAFKTIANGVLYPFQTIFKHALSLLPEQLPFVVIAVLIPLVFQLIYLSFSQEGFAWKPVIKKYGAPVLFGLVLLGLAIFPYAITGKFASQLGFETRHSLLIGLAMGIILVGSARIFFSNSMGKLSTAGFLLIMALCVSFGLMVVRNYAFWELRWIKDRSIMAHFEDHHDDYERYSVFIVEDLFPTPDKELYQFFEYTGMFNAVYGTQDKLGLDIRLNKEVNGFLFNTGVRFQVERYNLKNFDPRGCQATMRVRLAKTYQDYSTYRIVAEYYRLKFFSSPEDLNKFLGNFLEIKVTPYPTNVASSCRR